MDPTLDPKKQALAVALCLKGQARARAIEIKKETLNSDNGMDELLKALDELFLKDEVDIAYSAYTDFDSYKRSEGVSMVDFIVEFERRNNLCKKHNMELPDTILAFKLLDSSCLQEQER